MTSTKEMEKNGSPSTNGHVHSDKKYDSDKLAIPRKVYTHRNSVLTDLMEVKHLQSVFNMMVAICVLLFLNSVTFYLAAPEKLWDDISVMKWGAGKISHFVFFWILLQIFALLVYEGFKLWATVRNRIHTKIADGVFLLAFIGSIIFMYTSTAYYILAFKLPPITGFAAGAEQVRVFMKIYSFVRENAPRVMKYKPDKDGDQQNNLYPPRKHFLYFLFIPALLYRDTYPQTKEIRWEVVYNNFLKFVSVIFIAYCVFMRFNIDMFKDVGRHPLSKKEAAMIFAGSMAVGGILLFLIFYGILHCWLNIFAEILKFGDRHFYADWWNSTSFSQYYRRWNAVVYDWLHAYIHTDSQKLGCGRYISMILVFLISAVAHEYIISLALGFFYPALTLVYTTVGIFVIFLTSKRTTQFWNTFFWFMIYAGWGVLITCYCVEWYARRNCYKKETVLHFFLPRTWDPSCHILNFL